MSEMKHTPGPWWVEESGIRDRGGYICHTRPAQRYPGQEDRFIKETAERAANKALIAAAPELLDVLKEAVELAWIEDSHVVEFDSTVMFGEFYEFGNLERATRQEFIAEHSCVVWPGRKWSAYCTYEGSMWFEKFDTAEDAKEACMKLLDKVLPDHPAMRGRAAIAKATGGQP